jgi:hypothetical protein
MMKCYRIRMKTGNAAHRSTRATTYLDSAPAGHTLRKQ